MATTSSRETEIARLTESKDRVPALREHLDEIIEGKSFKGSHRSQRFLKYIVEHAIAGQFEMLKERVVGSELFGRSPSYDTGEDSIVRVTASDVRKRLIQHYDRYGSTSGFRISLPLGSYIPEIIDEQANRADANLLDPVMVRQNSTATLPASEAENSRLAPPSTAVGEQTVVLHNALDRETALSGARSKLWWIAFAILITGLNLTLLGASWTRFSRIKTATVSMPPWSAFFSSPHPMHLITSDPNIAEIQSLAGNSSPISLSDYANHNYVPASNTLSPEIKQFCAAVLIGNKAAASDTQIIADVAELAANNSRKIDVRIARKVQISEFRTDDNFILLGSPRSNPWFSLFTDRLDFQFFNTKEQTVIRNIHPGSGEQPFYVPTAKGGKTGETFAVIAFIQNLDKNGQVLLLAGADGEGTAASGNLVTDLTRLTAALRKCGISSPTPVKHFELLLRLSTIAGSPTTTDVVACHILPDSAGH